MSNNKKLSDFDKLKAKWYKKLEKSGFEDIESSEDRLKSYSNKFARKDEYMNSVDTWETKAEYYYIAEYFLNTHKFNSKLEKSIWEYHANGISVRNIVNILKKVRIETNKIVVWDTINRLRKIMRRQYVND